MWQVWGPESDATILVAEVNDSVVQVLCHCVTGTKLSAMFNEELASGGILVFEVTSVSLFSKAYIKIQ